MGRPHAKVPRKPQDLVHPPWVRLGRTAGQQRHRVPVSRNGSGRRLQWPVGPRAWGRFNSLWASRVFWNIQVTPNRNGVPGGWYCGPGRAALGRAPQGSLVLGRDGCERSQRAPAPTVPGHSAELRPAAPPSHPVRGEVQECSVHKGFSVSRVFAGTGWSNPHDSLSDPDASSVCPAAHRSPPGNQAVGWARCRPGRAGTKGLPVSAIHQRSHTCRHRSQHLSPTQRPPPPWAVTPVLSPPPQPAGKGSERPSALPGAAQLVRGTVQPCSLAWVHLAGTVTVTLTLQWGQRRPREVK